MMNKVKLVKIFCVVFLLVLGLCACEKNANEPINIDLSYDHYIDPNRIQASGSVKLYTEFLGGMIWDEYKSVDSPADGQPHEIQKNTVISCINEDFEYSSFGSYIGAWSYSEGTYESAELNLAVKARIVSAFNYIYDHYGSLDGWCEGADYVENVGLKATRVLTQMAVWYFMPPENTTWKILKIYAKDPRYEQINAVFADVVQAGYDLYNGTGTICGIAYLKSYNNWDNSLGYCQPQIVPVYSPPARKLGTTYNNVTATNKGNLLAILAGLDPNGNPYFDNKDNPNTPFVVPYSNHFLYSVLDVQSLANGGVELELFSTNNYQKVGEGFVVLLPNGYLEIAISGKGAFGIIAFSQLPVFENGNIHSQNVVDLAQFGAVTGFYHDNKFTIPCPSGTENIYLYIHCTTMRFYE